MFLTFTVQGWGCGYRTLQTLCSHIRLAKETAGQETRKDEPSLRQVQEALVAMQDKPDKFVGSQDWIGSFEVSLCLDYFHDVSLIQGCMGLFTGHLEIWASFHKWLPFLDTLLKPNRHSLRCHGFMVHALLLRMHTNVVYFRVMRRLCRREWNWLWNWRCVNRHPWQRTRDHGVWRLTLTAYTRCAISSALIWQKEASDKSDISRKRAKCVCHLHWRQWNIMMSYLTYLLVGWVFLHEI